MTRHTRHMKACDLKLLAVGSQRQSSSHAAAVNQSISRVTGRSKNHRLDVEDT